MAKLREMKRDEGFRRLAPRVERAFTPAFRCAQEDSVPSKNEAANATLKRRSTLTSQICRIVLAPSCAAAMMTATGCSRAPSFNILGSFFPAWLLCGILGIVSTVIVRVLFVRTGFEKELSPLILVYPCMAAFFTFSIWLVFFS